MSARANHALQFALGRTVITPGALAELTHDEVIGALTRHVRGDWGDVCPEDRKANEDSLKHGSRLLSSYRSAAGQKFWIITEADRSVTTVLLPEEY